MALATGTVWEVRASATTGNTGGSGFNPANANGLTDLTTDANTANTNSPVCSSASYNFVAGDVNAWLYIVSGTNWTPGWYQIASVASNKATLSGTIGAAMLADNTFNPPKYYTNTSAGCATVGTPTSGTFLIDYSQQDAAQATATDYTAVGASTTLTSASAGFTRMMVGNIFHQTTTGTGAHGLANWFEIVSYTNSTTVVLDRTPNDGTTSVACTGFVGGAGRLNGLEDAYFEMTPAGSMVWIKNGTYTLSAGISIASTASTTTSPTNIAGYNSVRGDTCTGSNRPQIVGGAFSVVHGVYQNLSNLILSATNAAGVGPGTGARLVNCKFLNSSATAARPACNPGTDSVAINCEMVSQNGIGLSATLTSVRALGCYIHDCATGVANTQTRAVVAFCIIENCTTDSFNFSNATGGNSVLYNTIYGREGKVGNGVNFSSATAPNNKLIGNIFYGLTNGAIGTTAAQYTNAGLYNCFNNNTTDVSLYGKDVTDVSSNPTFTGASQLTGTTATTSGSVLTDSGADFSTVSDNIDYLHVTAGTGTTLGCYLITSHTTTTLTVNNALGTGGTADKVYFVGVGHNFAIGTNLKAAGFPGVFNSNASETTGYIDIGAVQRQEAGGGAASFTFTG